MQRATDLHHQIAHPLFPQPNRVFDDPAAADAADHVFDHALPSRNDLIRGLLRIHQLPAFGLRVAGGAQAIFWRRQRTGHVLAVQAPVRGLPSSVRASRRPYRHRLLLVIATNYIANR
jgi:hypothetical protein